MNVTDREIAEGSSWLRFPERRASDAPTARVFCFAHAGGSVAAFRPWIADMLPDLEVIGVELPGHGDRILERPMSDIREAVAAIQLAMGPYLDRPYALYGHSMGAAVAMAAAQLLAADPDIPSPLTLVVGGCVPPSGYAESSWCLSPDCPDDELIEWMLGVGGTPPEVLAEPRMLRLVLRLMRADLGLLDSWWKDHQLVPLPHPIRAIAGRHDDVVPPEEMMAWQAETAADFSLTMVDGDHFFYSQATKTVRELIADDSVVATLCR